ncbi:hypothetical protein Tco_0896770, partial [Tanacetum coccineum]
MDERRVVVQDQRLKSIIMSCLPDDIIKSVISCKTPKATWTDLVYSFEGFSDTKKKQLMDGKPMRQPDPKKDFQENYDDEADERTSEEYLRDLDIDQVLLALADDELTVRKNHARNGEWIDITIRKGTSLSSESVLGLVTLSDTKQITPSVPSEVKNTKQESKINELTKLVQMLIDEKASLLLFPQVVCQQHLLSLKTEKEEIGDEKADNEREPVRATKAIPIFTIKLTDTVLEIPTPKDRVKIELIGSSRPQPTETPSEVPQAQPTGSILVITSPSQPESSRATPRTDKGKDKVTIKTEEPTRKLVHASRKVHHDPDAIILVPYEINGKIYQLTEEQIQAYLDKEDILKKTVEEAKLFAMTKYELIKTVTRKPINDVKIHPNSKPAVITVYRDTDRRNFKVHNPFKFGNFGINELDELGPIIQKKKDKIVAPEQGSSQLFKRKIRRILDHELRIPTLECNMSLPKGVPFVNNMGDEEPDYGMFFNDGFGDKAFQRMSDINKVGVETLITYLVMASNLTTRENQVLLSWQEIADHLTKEKDIALLHDRAIATAYSVGNPSEKVDSNRFATEQ